MAFHLVLLLVWLMIAVPLLAVNFLGQPVFGLEPGQPGLTMGIVAGLLALYNLARFYAARASSMGQPSVRPSKKKANVSTEYLPEFDFSRRSDNAPSGDQTDVPR